MEELVAEVNKLEKQKNESQAEMEKDRPAITIATFLIGSNVISIDETDWNDFVHANALLLESTELLREIKESGLGSQTLLALVLKNSDTPVEIPENIKGFVDRSVALETEIEKNGLSKLIVCLSKIAEKIDPMPTDLTKACSLIQRYSIISNELEKCAKTLVELVNNKRDPDFRLFMSQMAMQKEGLQNIIIALLTVHGYGVTKEQEKLANRIMKLLDPTDLIKQSLHEKVLNAL